MDKEGRYEKNNRFWEIIYNLDANEIWVRTGIKGNIGRLYIYYGFDNKEYDDLIIKKTNKKIKEGWKHISKHINREFTKNTLMDYRMEHFDYNGKKKIF